MNFFKIKMLNEKKRLIYKIQIIKKVVFPSKKLQKIKSLLDYKISQEKYYFIILN